MGDSENHQPFSHLLQKQTKPLPENYKSSLKKFRFILSQSSNHFFPVVTQYNPTPSNIDRSFSNQNQT